ncbi:hypothetical protein NHX12_015433 [Muraenolepis orangiensis]|uniref:Reverse transcriptase domain-containing protein n=1 Tax=Muraenolepis orangiensis TaxID=630683 RepID=A0A9Q0DA53_9TELE|nr:hypothetical protein NHX12_015433 [Muraenolepis orangiensis]
MASFGAPPVSLGHGVRLVAQAASTVEQVLLAVGDQVGHVNISYASRMNKAVVVFLKDQKYVTELIESGLVLNEEYVQVSPLATPSTRITVSGVPLFIPNEALERELKRFEKPRSFWQFNVKILQDLIFCENFKLFWINWKSKKESFPSLSQWWEVGKAQIRVFCQQYTAYSTANIRRAIEQLEREIRELESVSARNIEQSLLKQQQLNCFLQEKAKGALIRARFTSMRDIDAPTTFFFNLERSVGQRKQMVCLRLPDGQVTSEPAEMRRHAVSFYTDLFKAEGCDVEAADELFQGLPQLSPAESDTLGSDITLEELTSAVTQMASGKAPGIDGLPADFFKHFWSMLGQDLLDVLRESFGKGSLPASCRRAVISLLPKKGDLTLLKNWRPVALLCTDYKILSKVLANRLKCFIDFLIGTDQTYCIPGRSIVDNLFLMRDAFDVCKLYNLNVGIISIDQEKAFDRVDHTFLAATLQAFGVGEHFLSWVKVLYSDACCVVKVGGGLSRPVPVKRGIRQGCPISGLLYSIAIEPLLCRLRNRLRGLCLPESAQAPPVVVSAYADDVSVFIQGQRDIQELQDSLALYRKAASAKVNWEKSEAVLVGQWGVGNRPSLPGGLGWGNRGLKVLGVWLGSEDMVAQNWEGLLGKVQAKLAKWKWLLPQLSYRGRVLVANNLVASSLWHRLQVLTPPPGLMKQLQRLLVDFFWSGHHWVPASVLYLPVAEGGQGLVDITARTAAFRLQAAQRLLYGASPCWLAMARLLLWRAGGFGFDKHLFLLKAPAYEITGLVPFYCSVINAWKLLSFTRPPDPRPGMWLFEEPLFDTGFFPGTLFSSATLRNGFVEAGVVKLGHLTGISTEELAEVTGIRSIRVLENLVDEVWQSLSPSHRTFALDADLADQWKKGHEYVFPALSVGPAVGEWREEDGLLLSLGTLTPGEFSSCSGRRLYLSCLKVLNLRSLAGVRESRWTDVFGLAFSPQGSWRILYKSPVEKRMADIQWRIIHGAIATNQYRAHFDPGTRGGCPFCFVAETLEHLVVSCPRLAGLKNMLQGWVEGFGEVFSIPLFVHGPKYILKKRETLVLMNFLFANAKLAIWKSRKNQLAGVGWTDAVLCLRGLVAARLRVEHAYYTLINHLQGFLDVWAVGQVLCSLGENDSLILKF